MIQRVLVHSEASEKYSTWEVKLVKGVKTLDRAHRYILHVYNATRFSACIAQVTSHFLSLCCTWLLCREWNIAWRKLALICRTTCLLRAMRLNITACRNLHGSFRCQTPYWPGPYQMVQGFTQNPGLPGSRARIPLFSYKEIWHF